MADASKGRGRRSGKPSGSRSKYVPKGPLGTGERFKAALSAAGRKRAAAKRKAGGS